jgi:cytochrome c oxidase subunit 3
MHLYKSGFGFLIFALLNVLLIMCVWWKDVIREAHEGSHTQMVQKGLRLGFALFIASEVMFFFGFFWAFFHNSLSPALSFGSIWPPQGILSFNPQGTPLVNTVILLLSGATITYTHHFLIARRFAYTAFGFIETIFFAILFTLFQVYEYVKAPFAISDGIYGSVFYMITGFHGFHVIIGTLFIGVCFIRYLRYHFTAEHHLGFEFAVIYWHFVDVVWLFVFTFIYWWGAA